MSPKTHPLEGRVAVVTGAGRGIGRATALALSARGAAVVVNDLGLTLHGEMGEQGLAEQVVREIEAAGGRAVANDDSVSEWEGAQRIVATALESGRVLLTCDKDLTRLSLPGLSVEDPSARPASG